MSQPAEAPPDLLRVEKGRAEPEELAALTVVLCARLALSYAATDWYDRAEGTAGRQRAAHTACWSGCWTCG